MTLLTSLTDRKSSVHISDSKGDGKNVLVFFFLGALLREYGKQYQSCHIIPPIVVKFCWNSKVMPFVQLTFF